MATCFSGILGDLEELKIVSNSLKRDSYMFDNKGKC